MVSISVCMIVKNEERVLARCLDSLSGLYEELIIVDTGSTDRTKEIAGRYTDKVYDFQWIGDFSAARNYAFSKASCDYIYSADADEVLDKENHTRFLQLKSVQFIILTKNIVLSFINVCGSLYGRSRYMRRSVCLHWYLTVILPLSINRRAIMLREIFLII